MSDINREQWLNTVAGLLRPLFLEHGKQLPANLRISVGFPSHGALSTRRQTVGQCFYTEASNDKTFEIFISPVIGDGLRAADILVHELAHAVLPVGTKHGPIFARLAKQLGLEGKPTATHAGEDLASALQVILDEVGPYPHAALVPVVQVKPQTNRMNKTSCPECGYLARVAKKWLEIGPPICPTHNIPLVPEGAEGEPENE